MLPSIERVPRSEFQNILENKDILVIYNKLGTLKYVPIAPKILSVVTSSKHEKKAVLRNKLRRRIYSLAQTLPIPIQGIFYVAKSSYSLSFPEIKTLFNELLTKAQKTTK